MRRHMKEVIVFDSALVMSWCVLVWPFFVRDHPTELHPSLPLVSLPWDGLGDVTSSVPMLFYALSIGFGAAFIVEVAKASNLARTSLGTYVMCLLSQCIMIMEAFRGYAYDWWIWFGSWLNWWVLTDNALSFPSFGARFPFLSTLVLAASLLIGTYTRRPLGNTP
jgi:hypothetical protein